MAKTKIKPKFYFNENDYLTQVQPKNHRVYFRRPWRCQELFRPTGPAEKLCPKCLAKACSRYNKPKASVQPKDKGKRGELR